MRAMFALPPQPAPGLRIMNSSRNSVPPSSGSPGMVTRRAASSVQPTTAAATTSPAGSTTASATPTARLRTAGTRASPAEMPASSPVPIEVTVQRDGVRWWTGSCSNICTATTCATTSAPSSTSMRGSAA